MNKLLFTYERQFNDDIEIIANNHLDLEEYLKENYDWFLIVVKEDHVVIRERDGFEKEYAQLKWIKQI